MDNHFKMMLPKPPLSISKDTLLEPSANSLSINEPSRALYEPSADYSHQFESIGTFAPSCDYNASIGDSRYDVMSIPKPMQQKKKLEAQLDDIERLKRDYQNKMNERAQKGRASIMYRSSEKNSNAHNNTGRSLSNEKHNLRPSHTPTVPKKQTPIMSNQHCEYSPLCDNYSVKQTELSQAPSTQDQRGSKNNSSDPRFKQFYDRVRISSSRKQESYYEESNAGSGNKQQDFKREFSREETQRLKQESSVQLNNSSKVIQASSDKVAGEMIRLKDEELRARDIKIEQLKKENEQLRKKVEDSTAQTNKLKEDLKREAAEKVQLEQLLKDVLFEREREKMMRQKSMNNNAQKRNRPVYFKEKEITLGRPIRKNVGEENMNHFSNMNDDSSDLSLERIQLTESKQNITNKSRQSDPKAGKNKSNKMYESVTSQEDKKLKVQNILEKLKIKISRY